MSTTTVTTLKFKTSLLGGYESATQDGTYRVFKSYAIYSGIKGGGTYTSWRAIFTPAGTNTPVNLLIGNKYEPAEFNSRVADTKRLAVIACQAHADGENNIYEGRG